MRYGYDMVKIVRQTRRRRDKHVEHDQELRYYDSHKIHNTIAQCAPIESESVDDDDGDDGNDDHNRDRQENDDEKRSAPSRDSRMTIDDLPAATWTSSLVRADKRQDSARACGIPTPPKRERPVPG